MWKLYKRGFKDVHAMDPTFLLLTILSSAVRMMIPLINIYFSKRIVDALIAGVTWNSMLRLIVIVLLVNLVLLVSQSLLRSVLEVKNSKLLKMNIFNINKHQLDLDYAYSEDAKVQEQRRFLINSQYSMGKGLMTYVFHLEYFLTNFFGIIGSMALILGLFLVPSKVQYYFLAILFVSLVAVIFLEGKKSKKLNKILEETDLVVYHDNNMSNYLFSELLVNYEAAKEIRLYDEGDLLLNHWNKTVSTFLAYIKKTLTCAFLNDVTSLVLYYSIVFFVTMYAGYLAFMNAISVGTFLLYAGAIGQLMMWLPSVYHTYTEFVINENALQTHYDYFDLSSDRHVGVIPTEKRLDREFFIEVKDVSFKYPGTDRYVIKHLTTSFTIGKRVALVGENGSGKTTLIKLLLRLYDPTEGVITLNGIDIRKYDYKEYLDLFSVVFQDYTLFDFTLGENIAANASYDPKLAEHYLMRVGFKERYDRLKDKLNTYIHRGISDDGIEFSGGESQKIAMARALYKNAPFLIMDEPTAKLDPLSEYEIYKKMDEMVEDRTALFVSHRLSSCLFCDRIMVFSEGELVEEGKHEELLQKKGTYAMLWEAQAKYY
ncbi:ABC transporter ATP-binding protein [Guggenheimella bovis]